MLKKYSKWMVLFTAFFITPMISKAEEYKLFTDTDVYYRSKVLSTGYTSELKILKINNSIAYSLEIEKEFYHYISEKNEDFLNTIASSKLEYMKKVATYGYDPVNKDKKLYMAAQELIWEEMTNEDIIWEDNNGNVVDIENEKNSILEKVKGEYTPSKNDCNIEGTYFEEVVLEDKVSIYTDIQITNKTTNTILTDSSLKLVLRKSTSKPIKIEKEYKVGTETAVFDVYNSQKVITFDITKKQIDEINVSIEGDVSAYVSFYFYNNNNPINGEITFSLIGEEKYTFKTDSNGHFFSDILVKAGTYELQIDSLPDKYVFNDVGKKITVKDEEVDTEQKITFTQEIDIKKGTFELTRKGKVMNQSNMIEGSIYELYRIISKTDAEFVGLYETDKSGKFLIENLPIGNYYLLEKSVKEYAPYSEKIEFEITNQGDNIKKEIVTNHLPLSIMILDHQNYTYYLINKDGEKIQKLKINEVNKLYVDYGEYVVQVMEGEKLLYTWKITFNSDKDKYVYSTKEVLDPILFDMPTTGRRQTIPILYSLIFFLTTKLLYNKKVKN